MIKISIFKEQNQINSFEISGHANSGPYGYDLVCAAVSAVSFGAVNAVIQMCKIDLNIEQLDSGYLSVEIPKHTEPEMKKKAQLIFEAMYISLQTIEREYNRFIQIIEK